MTHFEAFMSTISRRHHRLIFGDWVYYPKHNRYINPVIGEHGNMCLREFLIQKKIYQEPEL